MTSLTIKNLPDDLLEALRVAAEKDRRSVTQEIIYLLYGALQDRLVPQPSPVRDVAAQIAAWRKLAGAWPSDVDPSAEAEEIMSSRTPGREVDFEAPGH
jgi:plasmid stability protein